MLLELASRIFFLPLTSFIFDMMEMTFANLNRQPTTEDIDEISQAISKWIDEIKNRINETKT
jgi:hypothetical protein